MIVKSWFVMLSTRSIIIFMMITMMCLKGIAVNALSSVTGSVSTTACASSFCGTTFSFVPAMKLASNGKRKFSNGLCGGIQRSFISMMPEGPEVRTLVDQLQGGVGMRLCDIRFLSGRYVRHGKPDGFAEFANTMTPRKMNDISSNPSVGDHENVDIIQEWNAKGKFIYLRLDDGSRKGNIENMTTSIVQQQDEDSENADDFQRSIWVTLGMSGRFVSEEEHERDSRHARWYFEVQDTVSQKIRKIYYHDMRNFGTIKFCLSAKALEVKLEKLLGPDILKEETTTEDVFVSLVAKQKPELNVCKFLMDQVKICGIGNYILAEGLYRSGVDPFASLSEIDHVQQRMLFRELQSVAQESYKAQGLTRQGGSYRDVDGNKGKFEFNLQCYGREYCVRGKPVRRETKGPHGRTIWYTDDQLFMTLSERRDGKVLLKNEIASDPDPFDFIGRSTSEMHRVESAEKEKELNDYNPEDNREYVDQLIAGLTDSTWKDALSSAITAKSFGDLSSFLATERSRGATIYPPERDIFSALNLCPLDNVKVVIVGQDPYHGPGQGHGLAFSVQRGVTPPPSLKNIFKEAAQDVGIDPPQHGCLTCWEEQGVLLLNSVLTVREREANSHSKQGWEDFTDGIIKILNDEKEGLVFLLWGNPAAKKARGVNEDKHVVIRTSHPSPLGATKTASPFLGSRCFSRCNAALEAAGKEPIDWNVV